MPRRLARSASQRAKNVLPAPYSPRTALKYGPAGRDAVQLLVDGALEPLHADREQVKARLRHGPPAQRVDDLRPAGRADRYRSGMARYSPKELLPEQRHVQLHQPCRRPVVSAQRSRQR